MDYDPLSAFRKAPVKGEIVPPTGPEEYMAFGTKDRVHRLRIRSAAAPVNAPGYNILLNIVSDEQHTNFILVYTILMVLVRGRNLEKMVFAIEHELADYIQEFDPARWPKPKDAAAPFIESIEIKVIEGGTANKDTRH